MDAEKPRRFFARFVDERGEPVSGFSGNFEHGSEPAIEMAFSGSGFATLGDLKGSAQAWLTLPDEARQNLSEALLARWKQIRGEADGAWRQKEETLREVFLDDAAAIGLQLEAEKKHTFVLRPPVARAHLHGLYFNSNKCFLLPSAVPSLRRLVTTYARHPDAEVLFVGHADAAGTEDDNLALSGERADAMQAYLCDDVEAWLAWYGEEVPKSKRWGKREDDDMIVALVPRFERRSRRLVTAFRRWHNSHGEHAEDGDDASAKRPAGWERVDDKGPMDAKTRRQLVLDYMNLDGTSLPKGTRTVTYGCGEMFPWTEAEGDTTDADAVDDKNIWFNRRVELFFFAKPFGILPEVPGVPAGTSSTSAVLADAGDKLYPEWRFRASRHYRIEGADREIVLLDELGCPLAGRRIRVLVPEHEAIAVVSDEDGKIRVRVPPACHFELVIEGVHEGAPGDSLTTASGHHFAAGGDGPEDEP